MNNFDMKITIMEGVQTWLWQYKRSTVKQGTFIRMQTSADMMRRYRIANVRLLDLETIDIQEYLNQLVADGYALTTIKKQYNLLTSYLKYLMGEGVPIKPAYMNAKLPSDSACKKRKKEVEAYTKAEQKRLMSVCEGNDSPGARAVILMIETGMRIGELLALQWDDVQWERKAVHIHRTLVNHNSRKRQFLQDTPKSFSSDRVIPLSDKVMRLLDRMYDEGGEGLLLPDAERPDESIGYSVLRNQITAICEEAGVPWRGMHVFRHTFATNAFYKGCSVKLLSKFLGHSDVTVTFNTYIHLYGDALEEMREIVK